MRALTLRIFALVMRLSRCRPGAFDTNARAAWVMTRDRHRADGKERR